MIVQTCQACPRLPPRHSFQRRGALISGGRIQKLLLTHPGQAFPDLAPSLLRLTGKGLMPLSSLSCSRSAFESGYPEVVSLRLTRCCHREAPDASMRYTNLSSIAPDRPCGFGPCPAGGFAVFLLHCAPALNQTAPPSFTAKHFPLARIHARACAE